MLTPPSKFLTKWCGSLLLSGLVVTSADGAELDWSSVTWSPNGSLSQTYNDVGGTQVDMSFNFPGTVTTGNVLYPPGSPQPSNSSFDNSTPQINTLITSDDALYLELEFGSQNPNEYVTMHLDFSEEVTDVSLTAFDIDFGAADFQDLVVIVGVTDTGTFVAPETLDTTAGINRLTRGTTGREFFDNTIYDPLDAFSIRRGGVVGLTDQNAIDGGSATWDFGTQELVGLRLVYTNGRDAPADPQGQWIALGNINFTPVIPEAETYWAGGALLFLLGLFEHRRRRLLDLN